MLILLLTAGPAAAQQTTMVPVTVDGEGVRLEMRIYRPPSAARPAPTLVFNHGSTGTGRDPSIALRPIDAPALSQFFAQGAADQVSRLCYPAAHGGALMSHER